GGAAATPEHVPAVSLSPKPRPSSLPAAPVREIQRSVAPHASATPPGRAPAVPASGDPLLDTYRSYRAGFSEFFASIRRELEATPAERREEQVLLLSQRFPELTREAQFRDYLAELKIDPLRVGQSDMEDWLRRLTDGLFPPKGWPINIAMAMERVG